jgi:threonine/homoserine/homoserine lactone efflux protein
MAEIVTEFHHFRLSSRSHGGTHSDMEASAALLAGLAAGIAIAMQVGAVSLLLVDAAVTAGPRVGVAAGMGVAAADLGFAVIAAAAGGTAGAALASHEGEIRVIAAIAIAAIAIHGLVAIARERGSARGERPLAERERAGRAKTWDGHAERERGRADGPASSHFARFLAITAANPLTIASFAAVAAALSLDGPLAAAAFAAGVGLASAAWHLALSLAAGHAGRWMTPRVRHGFAIAGRVGVLAIAAHLAVG